MNHKLHSSILSLVAVTCLLALSAQAGQPNQDGPGSLSAKGAKITQPQQTVDATTAADSGLPTVSLPAGTLWYNGDFDGVNGLANEQDTSLGSGQYAHTYDDFNVPAGPGWNVGSVFSNNLENTNVTGAYFEIHQGLSEGNGGTLVAAGMTMTPCVTPTGRSGFGLTEYQIQVPGLSLNLSPGTYFLNVTPVGDLTGRSFVSTTSGTNCIGTPCGNNQNAFFDSNFFGFYFTSTANLGQPYDYSMGMSTTPGCCVPPPSGFTLWLPFDETSGTTSANLFPGGNSGTQIGGPTVTSGYVDHSLCFNGQNQFVTVPNYPQINPGTGNLSIDAWVIRDPSSGNTTRVIIDHRQGRRGQLRGYHLAVSFGHLIFQLADSSGYTNYADTGTVPADGQWHFVAVTVDRASTTGGQFYIDGAATANFNPMLRPGNLNNSAAFRVAKGSPGISGNSPWLGCIDEVEFFPRVLTSAEIQSIYGAGSAGKCKCVPPPPNMVAWWPLDELTGAPFANDIIGFNNMGIPQPAGIGAPGGPSPVTGEVNGALYFGGSYLEVAPQAELDFGAGDFSIDAWVRPVDCSHGTGGNFAAIADKFDVNTNIGFSFYLDQPTLFVANLYLMINGSPVFMSSGTIPTQSPTWSHVAVTVTRPPIGAAVGTFYVNGLPAGTFTPPTGSVNNTLPLWIGLTRIPNGICENAIDELELFNRALSPAEVKSIADAKGAGKCHP